MMTNKEFYDYVFDGLGFCGCGDPESALQLLKEVLMELDKISNTKREDEESVDSFINRWKDCVDNHFNQLFGLIGGEGSGLSYTYLYWLDDKGLTEHGSAITSFWLTDRGKEVLQFLIENPDFALGMEAGFSYAQEEEDTK